MIRYIKTKIQEEVIFFASLFFAGWTSLMIHPSYKSIDLKVLASLFSLMLLGAAFRRVRLLDKVAIFILSKAKSERTIGITMILTTAVLGMLVTNDVALITIVPITILMAKKAGYDPFKTIVLETVAANVGGCLTPFGNPQNLYLYNYFRIPTDRFLLIMAPFCLISMILLLFINQRKTAKEMVFHLHSVEIKNKKKTGIYIGLFFLVLLSILHQIHFLITVPLLVLAVFVMDRTLFRQVDYFLLGTFICFFIFVDNVTRLPMLHVVLKELLSSPTVVFTASALSSQIISNVPSAILFSGFTKQGEALLLGVSVGGLGTMIASLANLIAYKIYLRSYSKKKYIKYYWKVNISMFILLFAAVFIFLQI